jgi:acyl-CoA synthetase (AMP-forming)/AMP-acid ligase II
LTLAGAYGLAAIRWPERTAIIDEDGTLTFSEVEHRTNTLARASRDAGVGERDAVAIMCRNHRGLIEATVASLKLGANVLYLDAALRAPTIADLLARARPVALIHDDEFSPLMPRARERRARFLAWCDAPHAQKPVLAELIEQGDTGELSPPSKRRGVAVLAAMTTDGGKQSERIVRCSLALPARLPATIPLKKGETTVVAAPISHPWGFTHLKLGLRLGSTLVMRRPSNPVTTLREIDQHQAAALVVLPEMLQNITSLQQDDAVPHDTTSLQLITISASSLSEDVAMPTIERFGPVLHSPGGETVVRLTGRWMSPCRSPAAAPRSARPTNAVRRRNHPTLS